MNTETQRFGVGGEKRCIFAPLRALILCKMNTEPQRFEAYRVKKLSGLCTSFSLCSLFVLLFLTSCKNEACERQVKSLDSISGAIHQKMTELRQADTIVLRKAISRYTNYRQFIQQNIQDTISKNEANYLQQFYSGGKNLVAFEANRRSLLARGSLLMSQLSKLITDAKDTNLDEEKLSLFAAQEKAEADKLIKNCVEQQQQFNASLQEFKLALSGVEDLIRSRNNGQLPTIIKEQADL